MGGSEEGEKLGVTLLATFVVRKQKQAEGMQNNFMWRVSGFVVVVVVFSLDKKN